MNNSAERFEAGELRLPSPRASPATRST